jgi:hypothetical protein
MEVNSPFASFSPVYVNKISIHDPGTQTLADRPDISHLCQYCLLVHAVAASVAIAAS